MEFVELNNGKMIPIIGIGPMIIGYDSRSKRKTNNKLVSLVNDVCYKFVQFPIQARKWTANLASAFEMGYTLLDNSSAYNNWPYVFEAINRSNIKRDNIFITTRVDNNTQVAGSDAIERELTDTLRLLHTDHVDLLQFHWPVTDCYIDTWLTMERMQQKGYCTTLGVANCHQHHISTIIEAGSIVPSINQVEITPLFTNKDLINYCQSRHIVVQAYSPIARHDERLFKLPILKALAAKYNKTLVQVILRWHIQNGCIPIVRSSKLERLKENIEIFDFCLSREDMDLIDSININSRVRFDPDNCDFSIL